MLKNVPILARANQIAVAAHERADGSGFPHGLRLDEIPRGARIIGLADAYDELISGIGVPAMTRFRAVQTLATSRASEFDPGVLGTLGALLAGPRAMRP
jgi:response regulator RpfG family c-di-GMP phosphodiesterase